ncbi:MAG TPA: M23 family metallopeptidase [Exilispira sp.]|nr:M23 family metallopeptidase [Exilispira sp.]
MKKTRINFLLCIIILLLISFLFFSQTVPKAIKFPDNAKGNYFVKIFYEKEKDTFNFYSVNLFEVPFQFKIYISNLNSFLYDVTFPFYSISKAKEGKKFLFSLKSKDKVEPKFWIEMSIGDPSSASCDNYIYILPFENGKEYFVYQGYNSNFTHKGTASYALDFSMPIGTPICAVRDGIVYNVVDIYNKSGLSSYYSKYTNFISIYHNDGTYSIYAHIKYKGSIVKVGEKVKAGQVIGYSGNTGRTSGPHLHIQINLPTYMAHKSVPVPFLDENGNGFYVKEGKFYKSVHIENLSEEAYKNFINNINSQYTIFPFIYYKRPNHLPLLDDDTIINYPEEEYEDFE